MARLEVVVDGQIWSVRRSIRIGPISFPVRSTIVRLADGQLWICSPPKPTPDLLVALAPLGQVGHVVAPNRQHHTYFADFLAQVPTADGAIALGLGDKIPELRGYRVLGEADWAEELVGIFIDGLPVLNEMVWIHQPTNTLIVTDLLFDFGPDSPWLVRLVAKLLGIDGRLAMSRTMKLAVNDKPALRHSVDRLMSYRIDRVMTSHDQIVDDDVPSRLAAAFAWLRT